MSQHLDVLAEAAATHPEGSEASSEQPAAQSGRARRHGRQQAARGGSSPTAGGGPVTKAAAMARVVLEHSTRISQAGFQELVQEITRCQELLVAAGSNFAAARDAHAQADMQRASARDAFRAEQGNEQLSALWHAKVAAAQEAQEAVRDARDALYCQQALSELLSRQLLQRQATGGDSIIPGALAAPAAAADAGELAGRLLSKPQGTKRKRGAPPEQCPYCSHSYTVRDGLSSQLDADGNRLHLRRCQCRRKTPPCRNCPECKQRPDVMQLSADANASYEYCQRVHACAICACKCPGAGKWVEGDPDSRHSFKERTQKRQEELLELGWQDAAAPASALPALTADGTTSAATAAPSSSAAAAEALQRPRRQQQQAQPARSLVPGSRRLPADIRLELERVQQQQQQLERQQEGQQEQQQEQQGTAAHSHQPGRLQPAGVPPPHPHHCQHQHQEQQQQHTSCHHPEHLHTCDHPHIDCTSECCSMVGGGEERAHDGLDAQQQSGSLVTILAELEAARTLLSTAVLTATDSAGLQSTLEQLAAALQQRAPALHQQHLQPALPAQTAPELPPEVLALVREVFLGPKGEAGVAAVSAFLQGQCFASLSDFEFLDLDLLQAGLGGNMPTFLLMKLLQLGRKRLAEQVQANATAGVIAQDPGHQQQQMQMN